MQRLMKLNLFCYGSIIFLYTSVLDDETHNTRIQKLGIFRPWLDKRFLQKTSPLRH